MRFRKLTGALAGAVAAGGLSVVALAAPAQAAPAPAFEGTCKWNSFTLNYATDVDVSIDDKDVTVELPGSTTFNAGIQIQGFGAVMTLRIDGQLVTVQGKEMYDPTRIGTGQFVSPDLTGTLAYPVDGDDVTIESLALDLSLFGQSAQAVCSGPAITPSDLVVDSTCTYGSFALPWKTPIDLAVDGNTVTATLPAKTTLNAPSINLQGFGAVLVLNMGGQFVTLQGKTMFPAGSQPAGNTYLAPPVLTGTLKYPAELGDVTVESLALDLSLFGMTAAAPCAGAGVTPSPVTFNTTCRYNTFALPWQGAIDVEVDGTAVSATIPAKASLGAPSVSLQGFGAVLGLAIDGQQVTLSGKDMFNPTVPGNSYLAAPELTGTLTAPVEDESDITVRSLAMDLSLFGQTAQAVCSTTGTTLTATSPALNSVKLAAAVSPASAGIVEFYEGATKIGQATVAAGAATLDVASVASGVHTYRAAFVPTSAKPIDSSTSSNTTVTVKGATTTNLTGSSDKANEVTLAATVAPNAAGKVEFREGATKVGEAAVADGAASVVLSGVAAGSHSYRATFVPADPTLFDNSTSATVTVTVTSPPPTGPSAACVKAQGDVKTTAAAVKKADAKVKSTKNAVKKAAKAAKKAKGKKAKAAKAKLNKAKKAASSAAKAAKTAKSKHSAATNAVKANC